MVKNLSLVLFLFFLLFAAPKSTYAQKEAGTSAQAAMSSPDAQFDRRVHILRAYLQKYNSPLADSAGTFVKTADTYNLDWKLVTAISGVESTFGQQIPYNSYNAWGWGVYGNNMIRFNSWDEGIEIISKGLREKYIDQWGAQDVYQIGRFYAASKTWASRVDYFMEKIDEFTLKDPVSLSISL